MNNHTNSVPSMPESRWIDVARSAVSTPWSPSQCPVCHAQSLLVEWRVVEILSREAAVDLRCPSCAAAESVRMTLPAAAPAFFPLQQLPKFLKAFQNDLMAIAEGIQAQMANIPVARFTTSALWDEARWSGTSYQWHDEDECPPIMALAFENPDAGREIFREYVEKQGQTDQFEELRITIIEGSPAGQQRGYSMHIYPDPDALAMYATGEGIVLDAKLTRCLDRWQRAYPIPGETDMMLPRFKEEFAKHKQFMIAPQVPRGGQNYADHTVGIIKHNIEFRELSEITRPDDVDAGALVVPALITPRT